ncbi:MAG: cysteine desulfurase [Candidatus Eremiobacteraeota bacterium]|nr:cysteine desulfurase [Candidatus Eremiobacteraeota bacterium]
MTAPRIYADHAATTPLGPEAAAALHAHAGTSFNPSSLHAEGRAARAVLDAARETVGRVLGARGREIVFTSSGTEADNLAIAGAARAMRGRGRHIVSARTEHHAVLNALARLREDDFEIELLEVDSGGRLDSGAFARALRPDTILASLMLGNNEIGTIHPIAELARLARARGVAVHVDAVQAAPYLDLNVRNLGVDLMTVSAHKFGGPKGVGALYAREGTALAPLIVGGSQEHGLRAGTQNVAGIAALAAALDAAAAARETETARVGALRDRFERGVLGSIPEGAINAASAPRLPHISSLAARGVAGTELLARLDLEGVAVSAGSACTSGAVTLSHVVAALGVPAWVERGTIRYSFGRQSSEQEVDRLLAMLPGIVGFLRVDEAFVGTTHRAPVTGLLEDMS